MMEVAPTVMTMFKMEPGVTAKKLTAVGALGGVVYGAWGWGFMGLGGGVLWGLVG